MSILLPQIDFSSTQNGRPVPQKAGLFGKIFPLHYLFKATPEHCCDVTIPFTLVCTGTISKLRRFLFLQLSMWDLLCGQGVSLGNGVGASVVELAISCILYIFTSTGISLALWFARSYGPSNRASRTSACNCCKALSPSDVTKRWPTSVIPTIWAGAIFLGVKYIGSRIQRIDWLMESKAQFLCFCLCDRSLK